MRRDKSEFRRRTERALTRVTAGFFGSVARFLPLVVLRCLADGVGNTICLIAPSRQRIAVDNLRRVLGDRFTPRQYRALARRVTRDLCRTLVELVKLPYLSQGRVAGLVSLEGVEHLHAALAAGHGALLLTGHFGNWEFLGARLAGAEGLPITVIARDSAESFTAHLINRSRASHGMEVLERENLRAVLRALQAGRIVGILPDQHAAVGGIVVDFLGRPAATAIGAATLALRTGCAVVPGFIYREPDGRFRIQVSPALELRRSGDRERDVRDNTQLFNDVLGAAIREHPEQWLWLHRRWKVDVPASRGPGTAAAAGEETHDG